MEERVAMGRSGDTCPKKKHAGNGGKRRITARSKAGGDANMRDRASKIRSAEGCQGDKARIRMCLEPCPAAMRKRRQNGNALFENTSIS